VQKRNLFSEGDKAYFEELAIGIDQKIVNYSIIAEKM